METTSPFGLCASAAALLLLAACTSDSAVSSACPGDEQLGTLAIAATLELDAAVEGGGAVCNFAVDTDFTATHSVTATLAWDPADGGEAALCLSNSRAEPMYGTHTGNTFSVTTGVSAVPLEACGGCQVNVEEVVTATIEVEDGVARITGGSMVDLLTSTGTSCATGTDCALPCQVDYSLSSSFQ